MSRTRVALLVLVAAAVLVAGVLNWLDYRSRHDETCFEQSAVDYAAGAVGTQPPRREFDC